MITEKAKAVIDTNVVISAAISKEGIPAKILMNLAKGDFENYTTQDIISEIKGIFGRNDIKNIVSYGYGEFLLANFAKYSILIVPLTDEKVIIEDKTDDKFINCALTAKADIVSGDRHLLKLRKYKGVNILSPREFLERLK